jgi:subtilisin family serine protease
MIVCNSAGNSGNNSWYYIGAPADADSILSVGSVNADGLSSSFSSYGPSSDGRVKPSVSAQGGNTTVITSSNTIATSNGTSFSSPIIAGMTACLWQAHYQKSNMQIINAIIQSAHLYQTPNDQMGYGIPNYSLANALLLDIEAVDEVTLDIYPNPVSSNARAYLYTANHTDISYRLLDIQGRVMLQGKNDWSYALIPIEIPTLSSGVYILEATIGGKVLVERLNVVD